MKPRQSIMQFRINPFRLSLLLMLSGLPLLGGILPSNAELAGVGEPIPRNTRPGGSRGECDRPDTFAQLPALTVLQPKSRSEATTHQALPTFLVYLPYELTANSPGRLVLETSGGQLLANPVFRNSLGNTILEVTIPPDSTDGLMVGEEYLVSFRVYCKDPNMNQSRPFSARATIRRTEVNSDGTAWYDALANAYQSGSHAQWRTMLETEGLSRIPIALETPQ